MNRKVMALNVALVLLVLMLGWQMRIRWKGMRAHIEEVRTQNAKPDRVLPPPTGDSPKAASPADYVDVAQKTLFSRDRNPNVVIEPPPPPPAPPPAPPMPPLPFYHGQMQFGPQPVAILSLKGSDQKSYQVGDTIGDFKLLAFDKQKIKFEWNEKEVERELADLRVKEAIPEQAAPPASNAATAIRAMTPPAAKETSGPPQMGNDMGSGMRGCTPGDNSPSGTVLNGYRKVVSRALMGSSCYWEQVK